MTPEWALVLPEKFNRRIEDGSMVFWRPGLTVWINVWGNDKAMMYAKWQTPRDPRWTQ
jgi:lipopolysaccharide/colanic/teichoic acid biosynthesis glycosyltransferase